MQMEDGLYKKVDTEWGEHLYAGEWCENVLFGDGNTQRDDEIALGYFTDPFEGRGVATIPYEKLLRGMLVIGPSGYGKSTLRTNILTQVAHDGHGFCHVDTKSGCERLLRRLPEHRLEDVVFLGEHNQEFINGFDLFETGSHSKSELEAASATVDAVFAGDYTGSRSREIAEVVFRLAIQKDIPLTDVKDILDLSVDDFDSDNIPPMAEVVLSLDKDNEIVEPFLQKWANLVGDLYSQKFISNPNPVSLYEAVEQGKIVLCNADGPPVIKSHIVGAFLRKLTEIVHARESDSGRFFISVDQCRISVSDYNLDTLFTHARSKNIGVIALVQYIGQHQEQDVNLLMSNCDSLICFNQTDIQSADTLASVLDKVGRKDLTEIGMYRFLGKFPARYDTAHLEIESFPPLEPRRDVDAVDGDQLSH